MTNYLMPAIWFSTSILVSWFVLTTIGLVTATTLRDMLVGVFWVVAHSLFMWCREGRL